MKEERPQTKSSDPNQTDWLTIKIEGEEEAAFLPAPDAQPANAATRTGGLGSFVRIDGQEICAVEASK